MRDPKSILITGGSSGIGAALARAYAASAVRLALSGRDGGRLDAVAADCRRRGAEVATEIVDVADAEAMARWLAEQDAARPLDLVIANAGISAGTGRAGESPAQARRIFATNVDGVLNTVLPAVELMHGRRGQIAIMSSLAGFRGFPGAPSYSASKAAVKAYGESLRGELHAGGVQVSVICPGFVKSRMTARNKYPMPMLMEADRAAGIIVRGLAKDQARIAFPWPIYALVWLVSSLPPGLLDPCLRRLPKKE